MTPLISAIAEAIPRLPYAWLRERRWFSSKGQTLESLEVSDWGALPIDEPALLAIIRAHYVGGREEEFLLPLLACTDPTPPAAGPVAFSIEADGASWPVYEAFGFQSVQRWLIEMMEQGGELALNKGKVVFLPTTELARAAHAEGAFEPMRLAGAEQSNTSIIYGKAAILKCYRRVVAGVNPDVEISRFLTTRAGFARTPRMMGSISYFGPHASEHSIGILQGFVPNRGDAWAHVLAGLELFVSQVRDLNTQSEEAARTRKTRHLAAALLGEIKELGALTAEMHLALASDENDPDFAPRPLHPEQVAVWQDLIRHQSATILGELERRAEDLPGAQRQGVENLLRLRPRLAQRIEELGALGKASITITRCHGDYHLGQVLAGESGFLVMDFEGEPLRSMAERRAHASPLKDVAGMLRSLSYATYSALFAASGDEALSLWMRAWEQCAREEFLEGYRGAAQDAAFLPRSEELQNTALAVFELEKALYELNYELNNRPDWLIIPLQGITRGM